VLSLELRFDRLLERLVRFCIEDVGAERAILALDEGGLVIRATASALGEVTLGSTPLRASTSAPASILEHVLRSGDIVVLDEASRDHRFSADPYFSKHSLKSALALPIGRPENPLGVMFFQNIRAPEAFSADRLEELRRLSSEMGVALENSLLYEECRLAEFQLRLLSKVSAVLAESLDFEACLAKVGAVVVPAIADWCIVDVRDRGKLRPVVFTHADPEKVSLVRALREKHPIDTNSAQPEATVLRSGSPLLVPEVTREFISAAAGNEEQLRLIEALEPHSLIIVPLVNQKRTLGSAMFVRSQPGKYYSTEDVALAEELGRRMAQTLDNARLHRELKQAVRQRIARDRYIRMTFRQLPGSVWTTDRNLRFTYVTGRVRQEVRPQPEAGMTLFEFLGTKNPTDASIAHHLAALSGEPQSYQYKFKGRWYAVLLEPLRDTHGQVTGCVGIAFDVTEQRETQERLERDDVRLAEAQRVAHIGSFEWDIATNVVTWSDELHRIYGLEPGQFEGTYEAFLQHVAPSDGESTKTVVLDALRNLKPFAYEHRIIRSDGSVRIVHTRGDVIKDEHGKPTRLVGSCWDITDLRNAIGNLERERSLSEATIEATADGLLVVNRTGNVIAYNQRFLALWRIPAELAQQRDDEKLLAFVLEQLEDPNSFLSAVHELYEHPDRESFDVLRFKDGRVFERYSIPQRVNADIVGRVWSFRDVTERERLFRRAVFLSDATRLLASLDVEPALDSVAHMAVPYMGDVCAVDLLGNGGPRRLLVVSRDPTQLVNPELHSAVLAGNTAIYSIGPRSCLAVPLLVKGVVIGALTFISARTRRYTPQDLELAEELARRAALSAENARLYQGAQEALQARDEFLSIAAHEIRGPITSIHMSIQTLQKGKVPPAVMPKVLEIIEREDRRLARFVDELLDLGSIRTGRIHFHFEQVDLGNLVREVSSRLGAELARTGSSLSITSQGRPIGQWDRFRLEQVVTNLLMNAIKFGLGKPIVVDVSEQEGNTTLVVKDQGIGIPPEMLEKIFKPFERAESVRHYGGLGLGLFIAQTIVKSLGGAIQVQSQRNVGSTFTVEFPKVKAA